MQKIDREVEFLISKKVKEFSFHINEDLKHFPEIDQLTEIIVKSVEDYKIAKKFNQIDEAKIYKATIKEMKFAREHLIRVMNMDFGRPTQKMLDMAEKANIDLKDPKVIEEFKIIQQQTLGDIQRMKQGKKPLTEAEMKLERTKLLNQRQEQRIQDHIKKQKEDQSAAIKNTERIVELLNKSQENLEASIEFEKQDKLSHKRDRICLAVLVLVWFLIIIYTNYFMGGATG